MDNDVVLARKALEAALADPKLFTPEEIHAFSDVVEGTRGPGKVTTLPEVKIEANPKDHTLFPDDAISTPITRGGPEPPNPAEHTNVSPSKFALMSEGHDKWANSLFYPKESPEAKSSASGVRELYRDPEYHAPQPQHDGLVGSLLHPLDSIAAATEKLPDFLGGGTEHVHEPSVQQFMRDEGPYLPPSFNQKHLGNEAAIERSPEFRMYADAQWLKAHDQAATEGRSVARHAYVSNEGWANKVRNWAVEGQGHAASAVHGAMDSATFGAVPKLLDIADPEGAAGRRSLDENFPVAHTAGAIAGFASPGGFGNELASGAAGLAKGLAPAAAKAVPRFVQAGAKGAVAAGTDVLGRAGVNAASGNPADWNATGRDAAIAALLGGGMGAGFDALGQAANFHGTNLREKIPALPVAEGFGGKTHWWHGFEPGPRYGELVAEGNAQTPRVHPVSLLAQKLEGPIAEQGDIIATQGKAATGKVNAAYYAEHANTRAPVTPLLQAASELHEGLHDPSGDPLPGQHEQATGMLRREIAKMADTKMRPEGPGTLGFDEAEAKGHNIDHLFRGLDQDQIDMIRSGGMGQGVEVQPRAYNPQRTDKIINGMDAALKAAQGPGGGPHPELERLLEASRAVRDQFPDSAHVPDGGNWADFKHNASVRQAMEERAAGMAGVPGATRGGAPRLSDNTFDAATQQVGQLAAQHPLSDQVRQFLNVDRARVGAAEQKGIAHPLSDAVTQFARDAQRQGAAFDGTVYRGVSPAELQALVKNPRAVSTLSVSASPDGAIPFARKSGGTMLEIKGAGAVPVDGIEGSNTYQEALIPKGTRFRVTGQREEGGVKVVTLERAESARQAPPLSAAEGKQLFNTIAGYGGPGGEPAATGRHPEVDATLRQYADQAGGQAPQQLADIPRVKAVEAVRDRAATKVKIHNGFPMTNLSGEGARMRLDPIMSRLALPSTQLGGLRGGGLGGAGAYPHYRQGQNENAPPPASLDEINRLLNPNQPY